MQYLPPLDGIRAMAIMAVLIFHVCPGALRGGFTGVDVFFVLSGYLITSINLPSLRQGSFSLREFYLRRIQRLLPNLMVMVLATLLLWVILMPPSGTAPVGRHGLWTLFNVSNIYIWKNLGGYWDDKVELAPLAHTWSLAIEEQFYLLFPGLLWLLTRQRMNRAWFWLMLATVVSFGLCLYGTFNRPAATFYLLPTRVWELLAGAALAAFFFRTGAHHGGTGMQMSARRRELVGWAGLVLMVAGFFLIEDGRSFPGAVALVPTVGTMLVLMVVGQASSVSRLLSTPFLGMVGKLSYSIYLWHWPMIILGKLQAELYGLPQMVGSVAGGLCGIFLGWLAYVGVERPLRNRGPGRSRRLAMVAAGFSLAVLFCGWGAQRKAAADTSAHFDKPSFHLGRFNAGRSEGLERIASTIPFQDVSFPPARGQKEDSWRSGGVIHLHGRERPQVVVFGSSHAMMYSRLVNSICEERGLSAAYFGVPSTSPFFEASVNANFPTEREAREFDETRRKWLKEWRPEVLFVIDKWDGRLGDPGLFEAKLRSFLAEVSPLVGRVVFVTQVPVVKGGNRFNLRELAAWRMSKGRGLPSLEPDASERLRQEAVAIAEATAVDFPNLRVLRAERPFYLDDGSIRYATGRSFFYADDNHLTDMGAEVLRAEFEEAILEAGTAADQK
jgi:peptidoglycan/LPS O-acetylase OafA/YrhL